MKLKPKYFEDFEVGLIFESEPTLITKQEIIEFASKYDPQSFHLDEEAAKNGPNGFPLGNHTRIYLRNNHLQYALTWFMIACGLVGVFFFANIKKIK